MLNKGLFFKSAIIISVSVILVFSNLCSIAENSAGSSSQVEVNLEQNKPSKDTNEEKKEIENEKSKQKVEKLPDITVIGEPQQIEYTAIKAKTATKTDTPIIAIPQTIMIISKDLLEDRGAMNLHDVWQNVAGVYTSLGGDSYGNVINYRGFSSAHNLGQSTLYSGLYHFNAK